MTQSKHGHLVGCQSLNNVVDGNVRRSANKQTKTLAQHLEDEFNQGVRFASLSLYQHRSRAKNSNPYAWRAMNQCHIARLQSKLDGFLL